MTLASLARRDVATSQGVLPLWSRPQAFDSARPLVLAIQGLFAGPDDLTGLAAEVEPIADVAVVCAPQPLPPDGPAAVAAWARALDELVEVVAPDRPVVALGVSVGALAALSLTAGPVRRVVAVEPPLVADGLWPVADLAPRVASDPAMRAAFWSLFGVAPGETAPRDYRPLLDALALPADVVLGGEPLEPRRRLEALPSLVGLAERRRLASHPRVRLHRAAGGHHVQLQDPKTLKEVLLEACRRAAAETAYDPRGLDEPLLEATPLTAARVLHWGPGGPDFARAYLAWNPAATLSVLGEDADAAPDAGEGRFDAVVLGAPPPAGLVERLAARLAAGGHLVMRGFTAEAAPAELRAALARAGVFLLPPIDAAGSGVLRALRPADGRPPPEPLRVEMLAFVTVPMDVRTRLPVRGLRSDPELSVTYAVAPHTPPAAPVDAPKVLILQRQGFVPLATVRAQFAYAIAHGWVVVIEFDDHPGLVAETQGTPWDPADLVRYGYAHAVQTTTEPLAGLFGAHNPEVRIFENAVFELAPFPAAEPPRRVFYGAVARGGLGVQVARSLAPVVAAFPDVAFEVLSDREVFDALPTGNKRFADYLPYEAYLQRMAGCAVSLSPIEALRMRETKSDAKFLDAARAGVLTIASPLIYDRVIEHGVNGLLARRLDDWAALLVEVLGRPDERRAMSRRAWEQVRRERMFARQIPERRAWYQELWDRRSELNAQAFARIPGLAQAVAAETAKRGR